MVSSCFIDLRPEPLATHLTPIPPVQHFLSSCHAGCGCRDRPRKQFLSSLPSRSSEPREKINASIVTMTLIRGIPAKLERSPKHPPVPSSRSPDYRLALSWRGRSYYYRFLSLFFLFPFWGWLSESHPHTTLVQRSALCYTFSPIRVLIFAV